MLDPIEMGDASGYCPVLVLALLVIALVFWGYSVNPLLAYKRIFTGAFGSLYGLSKTTVKAIPG